MRNKILCWQDIFFFLSQGNSHYSDYLGNKSNRNLKFYPVTKCDVAAIIENLKPKISTGIDNISSKLLRQYYRVTNHNY